jgi:hypothetical protein
LAYSSALHEVNKFPINRFLHQKLITCLFAECLKVAHRTRIGRDNLQNLTRCHVRQRLFGAQNRQRTVESPRIDFLVGGRRLQHESWRVDQAILRCGGFAKLRDRRRQRAPRPIDRRAVVDSPLLDRFDSIRGQRVRAQELDCGYFQFALFIG